jgi:hypothetical protein
VTYLPPQDLCPGDSVEILWWETIHKKLDARELTHGQSLGVSPLGVPLVALVDTGYSVPRYAVMNRCPATVVSVGNKDWFVIDEVFGREVRFPFSSRALKHNGGLLPAHRVDFWPWYRHPGGEVREAPRVLHLCTTPGHPVEFTRELPYLSVMTGVRSIRVVNRA